MKVLTLTQPWATLIAIGAKGIETRSWSTNYRGPLAIHAAAGLGPVGGRRGLYEQCMREPFYTVLDRFGYSTGLDLPLGAIVAVCELHSVVGTDLLAESKGARDITMADQTITDGRGNFFNRHYVKEDRGMKWPLTDQERAFGDYTPGRFAWLLANVRMLPEPVPARGALGLWDYEDAL